MKQSTAANRIIAATIFAASGLIFAPRAQAAPANLTIYPSTDIYPKGDWHLDSDIVSGSNFRDTTFASAGINYGLGPDRNGLLGRSDIGLEYLPAPLSGVSGSNRLAFNFKTQLYNRMALTARGPMSTRLVFGLRGFGPKGNPGIGNSTAPKDIIYLLGSHVLPIGRVHLGVAHSYAQRAFLQTPAGNAARTYAQLGYDVPISKQARLALDYYTGKSAISALAPSIRYELDNRGSFQVGLIRYNDCSIKPRHQIYGAFDYDFGRGASRVVHQRDVMNAMAQMKQMKQGSTLPPPPPPSAAEMAGTIPYAGQQSSSVAPAPLMWRN